MSTRVRISLLFMIVLGSLFHSFHTMAAPCCAGSNAVPSIITGDEKAFVGASFASGQVIGDAPGVGKGVPVFRDEYSNQEFRQSLFLNAATLLSDRLQVGTSIPVIHNQVQAGDRSEQATLLGDVSFTVGYEVLPEWEYSLWKPRVYSFFQWVVPTGRELMSSNQTLLTDVSGLGVHQFHLGLIAIKRWSDWDLNSVLKLGKEWTRSSEFFNASMGGGYSFLEDWRVGLSLECLYQSPERLRAQRLVWNSGASLTWLMGLDSSWNVTYTDQTIFGPAINTNLSRIVSLAFVQRFER